jgi:hypothetical protein
MTGPVQYRIAFREDGQWWRAYFVPTLDTMAGAVELASVRVKIVHGDAALKEQFMTFAKDLMNRAVVEVLGPDAKVTMWDTHDAPEHERGAP